MRHVKGSCFCGGIRYEIRGPLEGTLNCHCSDCRKAHGAAFRTRAAVRKSDFHFLDGEELLKGYKAKPDEERCFCSVCGSPIFTKIEGSEYIGFALGTLDDDPGVSPEMHVFVGDKAPWHHISDDLPEYQGFQGE